MSRMRTLIHALDNVCRKFGYRTGLTPVESPPADTTSIAYRFRKAMLEPANLGKCQCRISSQDMDAWAEYFGNKPHGVDGIALIEDPLVGEGTFCFEDRP